MLTDLVLTNPLNLHLNAWIFDARDRVERAKALETLQLIKINAGAPVVTVRDESACRKWLRDDEGVMADQIAEADTRSPEEGIIHE